MKSPVSQFMTYVMTVYYGLTKYIGFEPSFDVENGDNTKAITVHLGWIHFHVVEYEKYRIQIFVDSANI